MRPFPVGFRRSDVQQDCRFSSSRIVTPDGGMGQFNEFLNTQSGQTEDLENRPAPERRFFRTVQPYDGTGLQVLNRWPPVVPVVAADNAAVGRPVNGQEFTFRYLGCCLEKSGRFGVLLRGRGNEGIEPGCEGSGALMHARLPLVLLLG